MVCVHTVIHVLCIQLTWPPSLLSVPLHLCKVLTEPVGNSIVLRSHSPSIYSSSDYLIFMYECLGPTAIMRRPPRSFEIWRLWWEFFQDTWWSKNSQSCNQSTGEEVPERITMGKQNELSWPFCRCFVASQPSFCSIIMLPGTCSHWMKIPKRARPSSWHFCYYLWQRKSKWALMGTQMPV